MWYFSLNWLELFNMEIALPSLAQSEEPFNNADFIYFLASLITSGMKVDRSNLHEEECLGHRTWYLNNVTGPALQTTSNINKI